MSPTPPPIAPFGTGVAPDSRGLILQRGGDEVLLSKQGDRFMAMPKPGVTFAVDAFPGITEMRALASRSPALEFRCETADCDRLMDELRDSDKFSYVSHIYAFDGVPGTQVYLTDRITVQFDPELILEGVLAITQAFGLEYMRPVESIPNTHIFKVGEQARENPIKITNDLMANPHVFSAEPNAAMPTQTFYRPSDSFYSRQWYLQHSGGSQLVSGSHVDVERAWDLTRGTRSIVVAVTDDGFDLNHPDFKGAGKIVAPRDFKDNDFTPLPGSAADSHGTACAGVAIAEENGSGIVGVAPGCAFMPVRTTGYIDDDFLEDLFEWCASRGADVISCSWGASSVYFPLSSRQRAAINRAATQGRNGKGCVIVFASGNANRPVNGTINESGWPNNVLSGPTEWLSGFAVHPDVITVAASTSENRKAAYSNWGREISVTAPSNNAPPGTWLPSTGFIPTAPEVTGWLPGVGVFTTDRLGAAGYDAGDFTPNFGGTSSACPLVAGIAALVLSANPNLTAQQVKQVLEQTTDKIVDNNPDPQLGFRYGSYDGNGDSLWFGAGKVNAYKAVQRAIALGGGTPPEPPPAGSDIAGHWAEDFIQALLDRNIVSGFAEDGTFRPNNSLTRAQYAAILGNAFALPLRYPSRRFSDVSSSFWGAAAIDKAVRMGFLSGYPDGTFKPNANLTRADALVALVSGLSLTGGSLELLGKYRDRPQIPSYATDEIATATARRLVVNYPSIDLLRPTNAIMRGEVCANVYQAMVARGQVAPITSPYIVDPGSSGGGDPGSNIFTDIAGHWAAVFIEPLAIADYVSGFSDRTFRPDRTITRAEMAALIVKAFNPAPIRTGKTFSDVPSNHWAASTIQTAYRGGFMSGTSSSTFGPDQQIDRVQAVVSLASGLQWRDESTLKLTYFDDYASIPTWGQGKTAAAGIRRAIVNYPTLKRFNPLRSATRGEVAAFVHQALVAEGQLSPVSSGYIVQL
jgi:subtilisin family serine protease